MAKGDVAAAGDVVSVEVDADALPAGAVPEPSSPLTVVLETKDFVVVFRVFFGRLIVLRRPSTVRRHGHGRQEHELPKNNDNNGQPGAPPTGGGALRHPPRTALPASPVSILPVQSHDFEFGVLSSLNSLRCCCCVRTFLHLNQM